MALAFTLALHACATAPTDPAARAEFEKTNDPLEPLNREVFDLNLFVDRVLVKPVAQGYVAVVPEVGRNAIRHFLDNLGEPLAFANNILQNLMMCFQFPGATLPYRSCRYFREEEALRG